MGFPLFLLPKYIQEYFFGALGVKMVGRSLAASHRLTSPYPALPRPAPPRRAPLGLASPRYPAVPCSDTVGILIRPRTQLPPLTPNCLRRSSWIFLWTASNGGNPLRQTTARPRRLTLRLPKITILDVSAEALMH